MVKLERISKAKNYIRMASYGLLLTAFLSTTACGYLEKLSPKSDGKITTQNMPNESDPGYQKAMNAMGGPKGISDHAYMTTEVQDSIMRLAKLHQAVSDMQNRMQVVSPSVDQLEMMKTEINALGQKFDQMQITLQRDALNTPNGQMMTSNTTSEMGWPQIATEQNKRPMQILRANTNIAPKTMPQPKPAVTTYQDANASFASQIPQGATGLIDVRIGEHKGKTRMVLDMAQAVDIRYDLDNEENIMVVELPGGTSMTTRSKTFPKSSLLKGYDIQDNGDSTLAIFAFKKPTSIVETMQLKGRGQSAHRIVFDMDK
jgi:HAMP domain-containing protein